jgi:hypothetical protein
LIDPLGDVKELAGEIPRLLCRSAISGEPVVEIAGMLSLTPESALIVSNDSAKPD